MLRKKKINKPKRIVETDNKKEIRDKQTLIREAVVSVFGEEEVKKIEEELKKNKPTKTRLNFTTKPLMQFLDEHPNFFDCSPEEKHRRTINYPFLEYMESAQRETFKYNIISIKEIEDGKWNVEYFDYHNEFEVFSGSKEEIIKFFDMNEADLYYIAKVIIPKNNRMDSPFYSLLKKIKLKK